MGRDRFWPVEVHLSGDEAYRVVPRPAVDGRGRAVVSNAGGTLLLRTAMAVELDTALSTELGRWRRPTARHDPGKIVLDLAVSLAIGGDYLADIAPATGAARRVRSGPLGPDGVRLIGTLAADAPTALTAIDTARAAARVTAATPPTRCRGGVASATSRIRRR